SCVSVPRLGCGCLLVCAASVVTAFLGKEVGREKNKFESRYAWFIYEKILFLFMAGGFPRFSLSPVRRVPQGGFICRRRLRSRFVVGSALGEFSQHEQS